MSRTSKALKRLGVVGVAAVTIGAGLPVLLASPAQAAGPTTQLVITGPDAGSAGDCLVYTVTPQDSTGGAPTDTQGQTILLTATPTGTNQVSFCTPSPSYPNTGTATTGTTAGRSTSGTATNPGGNNPTGAQTFGVRSDSPGGATIRAFIDTPPVSLNNNGTYDAGEPTGTKSVTFTAGGNNVNDVSIGGNAAQDAVSTITEVAQPTTADPIAAGGGNHFVTAKLTNAAGHPVSGVTVSAFFGAGSANGAQTSPVAAAQAITCTGGSTKDDGTGTIVLTAPTGSTTDTGSQNAGPVSNNSGFITCYYAAARAGTDTVTLYVNQTDGTSSNFDSSAEPSLTVTRNTLGAPNTTVTEARNIDLTPEGPTTVVTGSGAASQTYTATVKDKDGKPVQGVSVFFGLSGNAGRFATGATNPVNTNAQGQATIALTAIQGESGQAVVTAFINTGGTQCADPAGTPAGATAGNCSDSEVTNFSPASASPSATASPTGTASPTAGGRTPLTLTVLTPTIPAGANGQMRATGAASEQYQLMCYTRPSTTYFVARSGAFDAAGSPVTFTLSLGRNTRCFIQYATNPAQGASASGVINVTTVLSLSTVRTGVRTYVFQGRNLPRVAGQLITLYRVDAAGNEIRTSNLVTDSSGIYRVTRTFTGTGTFRFKVRTSQTLNNAAGVSNTITVRVF